MKKQAFITKSNFNSIITSLEKIGQEDSTDHSDVYKWPVYFLSKIEEERLIKQREFLKNPEKVFSVYKKRKKVDTKQYVYEGHQPAYHTRKDCPNLQSKYRNYEIPVEIKERGDEEIQKFRQWFKENQIFLESKPDLFVAKLQIAFRLSNIPNAIDHENTGAKEFDNLDLKVLEERIDSILRASGSFYKDNPDKHTILRRFQKLTFLAYTKDPIRNNDTELTDDELRSFLFEYDSTFKKPFKDLLLQYYMVKFNPELNFDGYLLEQLGFKICQNCLEKDLNESPNKKE